MNTEAPSITRQEALEIQASAPSVSIAMTSPVTTGRYLYEVAATRPESAADSLGGLSHAALLDAMRMIPDEYHASETRLPVRFIASILANAAAAGRSPYTIAMLALDAP